MTERSSQLRHRRRWSYTYRPFHAKRRGSFSMLIHSSNGQLGRVRFSLCAHCEIKTNEEERVLKARHVIFQGGELWGHNAKPTRFRKKKKNKIKSVRVSWKLVSALWSLARARLDDLLIAYVRLESGPFSGRLWMFREHWFVTREFFL